MSIEIRFRIPRAEFTLDVDLNVPGRGVTSLFGPSGCGKTTLLRAVAGLERHSGGYLRVGGETWQDEKHFLSPHRRPIGYVFQEASLFDHLSVRGNLTFGLKRVPAARRRVSLDRAIGLLGIERLLDRRPASLSGGERQRVAIARALAVSPELLLMDEPLAAVDHDRKQEILPWIESLHRELDCPVIHVSHLPEETGRLADHLVLLDAGRVVAAGDMHDLFTRLDLSLAHGEEAAGFVEAVVVRHDSRYHLTELEFEGGRLFVPLEHRAPGDRVRLRLAARDISLTLERQRGSSILNIFPATVKAVTQDGEAGAIVSLLAGEAPLLARVTRKSADELELAPGRQVFAQVKTIALLA